MTFEVRYGDDVVSEVLRLRNLGMTMRSIAVEVGIGRSTVCRIINGQRACDVVVEG